MLVRKPARARRWFRLLPLGVAIVAAITVIAPAAPASAAYADPFTACSQGLRPDIWDSFTLSGGNSAGVGDPAGPNPPNILSYGDVYSIDIGGWVSIDLWGTTFGPSGNGTPAPAGWPFPGNWQYSAVLRFNNNPGGWVGVPVQASQQGGCRTWTSGYPVRLGFYVNDTQFWDNGGQWYITVRIWKRA
jgi:hypothetical protein